MARHTDSTTINNKPKVPDFLLNFDYYFLKNCETAEELLEAEDENESIKKRLNNQEQDLETKSKQDRTSALISKLEGQIDDTNRALEKITKLLEGNANVTEEYISKVIAEAPDVVRPNLEQLQKVVAKMNVLISHLPAHK